MPHAPIHGGDPRRFAEQRVLLAPAPNNVAYQVLLAVVRRDDRDLFGRVADEAHVHVNLHEVLRLAEVLVEVRVRAELALALVVLHVDELVLTREAGVGSLELRLEIASNQHQIM